MSDCTKTNEKDQKILDAATKFFLIHGFSGTTTDMIQKEAGVSKATMYGCFKNKEAMFAAVIERQCTNMQKQIMSVETKAKNLRSALTEIGKTYLCFILSHSGLAFFRVCIAEAVRFPELSEKFFEVGPQRLANIIAGYLEKSVKQGEIELTSSSEVAANIFLSLLRSDAHLKCLTHPDYLISANEISIWVEYAVDLFLKNINYKLD
ncbi:TetR/AcrR family transcriptional regulator [Acinetobacter baumannii]|jgi:AcrR family transcriptional regulator|nr:MULTISPECIES: TetR/AcrR family transcriptional regulator [Acinetobacter calcoaceticus/baumannii complex]KCY47044.1 bacterial regulatory s, tetR family protein [Acinetobacter baumannii 1571545]EHU1308032.1 TetR/AcrR family transcriptional regulator [Acinetobacter baumannii]EHU1430507.1 TetR/AcrR family transcriptional regulator [Acinetobacter baumannii]EHU2160932.1 TetR/AcrR family transcriptional regulator [Acinetobacter baumannii]EHU2365125.1 TetR/AcrR family transcriptional regulator [Aci